MSTDGQVIVDFNGDAGRFEISCPFHLNGLVQSLPTRRWNKSRKLWYVPATRKNVECINNTFRTAMFTESAKGELNKDRGPEAKVSDRAFPPSFPFKKEPRSLQVQALEKVHPLDTYALLMGMRTGKTKASIDNISAHHMAGRLNGAVVVPPNSVKREWRDQIAEHISDEVDYSVFVLEAGQQRKFRKWLGELGDKMAWLIIGLESFSGGRTAYDCASEFLLARKAHLLVDESTGIKNHKATRSEKICKLGKMADQRSILTGQPLTNSPMDFFGQFEFLDPDILGFGDYYSFRNTYAIMGGFESKEIIGYKNIDDMVESVAPFVFQARTPKTVPESHHRRVVQLSKSQKDAIRQIGKEREIESGDGWKMKAETVLELMLRRQQIACGFLSFDKWIEDAITGKQKRNTQIQELDDPKLPELMRVADETDEKIIVWCIYRPQIERVAAALKQRYGEEAVAEVHGGIDEEQRHHNVRQRFQKGSARFVVGYPKLGARGLDMSAGTVMVFMGNLFEFEARDQAMYRFLGEAQKNAVAYIDIVAQNSVDEIVLEALEQKRDVADYVRDNLETVIARLQNGG